MPSRAPVRTCIGCRARAPAPELIRLRLLDGVVQMGTGQGRGASIHPRPGCIEAAARSNAFARAFKQPAASIVLPDFGTLWSKS
jgi:predicted RNA-binding protein YlxR (DUF448 family)